MKEPPGEALQFCFITCQIVRGRHEYTFWLKLISSPDDYSVSTAKQSPFSLKKQWHWKIQSKQLLNPFFFKFYLNHSRKLKLNFGQGRIWTHDLGMDLPLLYHWATRPKRAKKWFNPRCLFSCILLSQNHAAKGDYPWFLCLTSYMYIKLAEEYSVTDKKKKKSFPTYMYLLIINRRQVKYNSNDEENKSD